MASSRSSPGPHDRRDYNAPRPTCIKITERTHKRCKRYPTQGSKLCISHLEQVKAHAAGRLAHGGAIPGGPPHQGSDGARAGITTAVHAEGNRKGARARGGGGSRSQLNTLPNPRLPKVIDLSGQSSQSDQSGQSGPGLNRSPSSTSSPSRPSRDSGYRQPSATSFVVTEQAKLALSKLGLPTSSLDLTGQGGGPRFDPKQALLDTVHSAWRQRQVWEAMLNSVPDEDWAEVGSAPIPGLIHTAKGARIEAIQKFLSEATKVAARTSKLAIDAGIEERLVRLAEEQSALIADTVRAAVIAAIGSLHLSPLAEAAAITMALGSAATHLRALATGAGSHSPSGPQGSTREIIEGIAIKVSYPDPREDEVLSHG